MKRSIAEVILGADELGEWVYFAFKSLVVLII